MPFRCLLPTVATGRRRARRRWAAAALAVWAVAVTGCGAAAAPPPAHRLSVVVSNFPLAQLASAVGGNRVTVTDLAAGAADDRTVSPSAVQVARLRSAALVLEVGDGYQPAVEKAAGTGPRVLALRPVVGGDAQFWLDPSLMGKATTAVEHALTRLDPAGRSTYANGAEAFQAVLSTLGIDFESTLSVCPDKVFAAPDAAFGPVMAASAIHVMVVPAGAAPATVAADASTLRNDSIPTVFSEPPVTDAALGSVARRAGARVRPLDTLDGPRLPRQPGQDTYYSRMETDLGWLASGLQCPAAGPSGE